MLLNHVNISTILSLISNVHSPKRPIQSFTSLIASSIIASLRTWPIIQMIHQIHVPDLVRDSGGIITPAERFPLGLQDLLIAVQPARRQFALLHQVLFLQRSLPILDRFICVLVYFLNMRLQGLARCYDLIRMRCVAGGSHNVFLALSAIRIRG